MTINTAFDFRSDTPEGLDPDKYSPTLRRYHQRLWSKPLPSGQVFDLTDTKPRIYLHHKSDALGEFELSSDAVMQTYIRKTVLNPVTEPLGEAALQEFYALGYTIGGMMLFPSNKVDKKITINVARGFNHSISDRMDLTLECIRRYYRGEDSPLAEVLQRYASFFALFRSFRGYVEFWLLQDLVDGDRIRFFMPFDGFVSRATPGDTATYREFRHRSMEFIHARNDRIDSSDID